LVGVLPHVTVERTHLARYCSETVIADSGKQARSQGGNWALAPTKFSKTCLVVRQNKFQSLCCTWK